MTADRFACPNGCALLEHIESKGVARSEARFHTWGFAGPFGPVSSRADALQELSNRLAWHHAGEAGPIIEQITRKIEDLKQGDLFAQGGIIHG